MMQEIGSYFWLSPNTTYLERTINPMLFCCQGEDYAWLSTGRSAIRFVLSSLKSERTIISASALIPSFTCNTVAEPFLAEGFNVETIPVSKRLQYDADEIMEMIKSVNPGVVLLHHYFGFQSIKDGSELVRYLRDAGVIVIEDRTQCLYSRFETLGAEFTVGSIRKWGGMPDGGFAVRENGIFADKPEKQDEILEKAKAQASYAKYRYLFGGEGEKEYFLKKYQEAENILEAQKDYYKACKLSMSVQAGMNLPMLREKRRTNYSVLLNGLYECRTIEPLLSELPRSVVPLYFPITVEDRSKLQLFLRKHQIYAPIIWPKPDMFGDVCQNAEFLYRHLLCIPIDQRYDVDDMLRIVETIQQFEKE